jgi:hypothetical protein
MFDGNCKVAGGGEEGLLMDAPVGTSVCIAPPNVHLLMQLLRASIHSGFPPTQIRISTALNLDLNSSSSVPSLNKDFFLNQFGCQF